MLTDAPRAVLAPLIDACRPAPETAHHNLRRTLEAVIWRHENGARWHHIPARRRWGPAAAAVAAAALRDG